MLFGILKLLWMAKKQKEIVMTNNLLNLKKDLKSFAKKCKDFKYTDSALLTFLLNGMLISTGEMFAETVTKSQINNQVSQINT